jgi:hypothetical protein
MKLFILISFVAVLLLSSCHDCTWVRTGTGYTRDGEEIEIGYWDCPEDNPVGVVVEKPNIDVFFDYWQRGISGGTIFYCTIFIENDGNAAAKNIDCSIIIGPESGIMNQYCKKVEKEYDYEELNEKGKIKIDITYEIFIMYGGKNAFDVDVNLKYEDDEGKSYSKSKHFEF